MRLGSWIGITKGQGTWQLVAENGVLARLLLTEQDNGYAIASSNSQKWFFENKGGVLKQNLEIHNLSENESINIKTSFSDGTKIKIQDRTYKWAWGRAGSWDRVWRDQNNLAIITYQIQSRDQFGYHVDFEENVEDENLSLLIVLGFYLMALEAKREKRKSFAEVELQDLMLERKNESKNVYFNYLLGL